MRDKLLTLITYLIVFGLPAYFAVYLLWLR